MTWWRVSGASKRVWRGMARATLEQLVVLGNVPYVRPLRSSHELRPLNPPHHDMVEGVEGIQPGLARHGR